MWLRMVFQMMVFACLIDGLALIYFGVTSDNAIAVKFGAFTVLASLIFAGIYQLRRRAKRRALQSD